MFASLIYPFPINVQGSKMYVDRNDCLWLMYGNDPIYEQFETEIFKKIVKKGDNVIDIGANIGYYTLLLSKLVGENGHVFAFEPEPNNFELLRKNVEVNGYKNVTLVQKAVSYKSEKCKLYLHGSNNIGNNTIYYYEGRKCIEIETITLDEYLKNKKIDFIKIDVDGAEGGVIKGMAELLKQDNLKIITEFYPKGFNEFGIKGDEYFNILQKNGFKMYGLTDKLEQTNISILSKKILNADSTNILCVKKEYI